MTQRRHKPISKPRRKASGAPKKIVWWNEGCDDSKTWNRRREDKAQWLEEQLSKQRSVSKATKSEYRFCPRSDAIWQWRHNIYTLSNIFFGNALRCLLTLDTCLLLCDVSQNTIRGISIYLGISKKGYKLRMDWKLDLIKINLILFGCFPNVSITHSFCKRPVYTLQRAERK